jgi:ADP-heptose:LPS heptosyltransferase
MFDYQRVLFILPERLGDALFHTPAIALLRHMRPHIRIGVVALSSLTGSLLKNNPALDDVYVLPDRARTREIARDYDVVLKVHDHGEARKYVEWLGLPMLTYTYVPTDLHRSQRSLYLLRDLLECEIPPGLDRYRLYPDASDSLAVAAMLGDAGYRADRDILIGCHIGCHSIAKRGFRFWKPLAHPKVWPFEHFVALEAELRRVDPRFRLVLTGSKAEKKMAAKFIRLAPKAIDLVDRTSVLQLAALTDVLALFVSSDTGALHVACAGEVGVIALFGPTSLVLTGPYPPSPAYRVLQAPRIDDISVEQVLATILQHPAVIAARAH